MNYKTDSYKKRKREKNSGRKTKNINGKHIIINPGFCTPVTDINTSRDKFTNYNGDEQTCYELKNAPTYLDLVVAKHPEYSDAWYVFDRETGKTASRYGGDTREQAVIQFSQDMEFLLREHSYSIDNINQYLKQHE